MGKKLLFAIMLLCTAAVYAQKCLPDSGFWADFDGMLGNRGIQLSIYKLADGSLSGNYRYINDEKMVFALTGNVKDCTYYLNALNDHHEAVGKFIFHYTYDKAKKTDNFNGTYTGTDNKPTAVRLQLNSMVGGSATQRYFELFGTTPEVDSFAAKIKAAFIHNDKNWLAAHCSYPLTTYTHSGKQKKRIIKDQQEFIASYNKLFSEAYKNKFAKMHCYNMFSNHMGASMGKGEVWMNHTRTSTADNYEYCITAFEIFFL